jgi:hypothetical protein
LRDSVTNTDAYSYIHPDARGNSYCYAYGNGYTDSNSYDKTNSYSCTKCQSDINAYHNTDCYSNTKWNTNGYTYSYSQSERYAHSNAEREFNAWSYSHSKGAPDCEAATHSSATTIEPLCLTREFSRCYLSNLLQTCHADSDRSRK